MFQSINPFTEEPFSETSPLSRKEWEAKLDISNQVFSTWNSPGLKERLILVQKLAELMDREKKELASLITKEMGKPAGQSLSEIKKCIWFCEYAVERTPFILADKVKLPLAPENSYVTHQPLGVVLGIMPWNFPFWQVFRFALPTLLSGNTVLVKHAPNVMLCAIELEKLFLKAGFPSGAYQNVPITVEQTEKLIASPYLKGVSLTGSVEAGRAVAALSGRHLKKSLLELGGSDPYLILDSADLDLAAKECVLSRMNNAGQSCIAAKRFIVTKKNEEEFVSLVKREMSHYKMGDPGLTETNLGPLARKDLRDRLHSQVSHLVDKGAKLLLGGRLPDRQGYFYPPTILKSAASSAVSSFEEELFGPVASVIVVSNEEEAIETANASSYGLGAAIFSRDIARAEKLAREKLQAGSCVVNQALHSHPALPFGGVKDSGYGRELSTWGFYEFVNVKTIQITHPKI